MNFSKNFKLSTLANSYPSVIILGWTPSLINLSAYFINSPINKTFDVVPSPTISSYAVADLAIMAAVGCYIYISFNKTFPSFVNFI